MVISVHSSSESLIYWICFYFVLISSDVCVCEYFFCIAVYNLSETVSVNAKSDAANRG